MKNIRLLHDKIIEKPDLPALGYPQKALLLGELFDTIWFSHKIIQ